MTHDTHIHKCKKQNNTWNSCYKYKFYSGYNNPKWLVTEDKIVAVDKESRSITPDLAPEGYDPKDEFISGGRLDVFTRQTL